MLKNFDVTTGHSLYSHQRYRKDVRHMVIFDDLMDTPCIRVRLFLTDEAYGYVKKEANVGHIKIVCDADVIDGDIVERPKKKHRK